MNEHDRRRRVFAAQGFAAVAFVVLAHGAHAATPPAQPATPAPAAAIQAQARAE